MTARNYARLAASIFAIIAVLQLARAASGLPVTVGTTTIIPLWASWIACFVAAGLAWLGLAHRELEPVCSNQGCPPDPRNGHDQLLIPAVRHSPVFAAGASCDSKST